MNNKHICIDCDEIIPERRVQVLESWGKPVERCAKCQSKRDEYPPPPDFAMAEFAEPDDVARVRESGWGQVSEIRKSRTVKTSSRVTPIFHLAS